MNTSLNEPPFDAPRLRELHAASGGGDGVSMEPAMQLALDANFGSVARWREEFETCAKALGDGIGWVLLCFQPLEGSLINQWAADPAQAVRGGVPILALDIDHHGPISSPSAAASEDLAAFLNHIDWAAAYARYQHAVHAASEAHGITLDDAAAARLAAAGTRVANKGAVMAEAKASLDADLDADTQGPLLIDVRRASVYAKASTTLPGAQWRDPALVSSWAAELAPERELLVYCVYGHEVGRATTLRLRAAGLQARYLNGGIDGWQAAGRPLQAKT